MTTEYEFMILDWIQAHLRCGFLDVIMPKITLLGNAGLFWILLTMVLLAFPRTRVLGVASALALLCDVLMVNVALKHIFMRPRPYELREVLLSITAPTDTSFPSGHTAASFASACALMMMGRVCPSVKNFSRALGIPALVLATLIAFSRVYLYVHFPTDVLGGLVCGITCGFLGSRIAVFLKAKYEEYSAI